MNIRPATKDDDEFLKTMLYEAARWNPDWPREPMEEVLDEPMLAPLPRGLGARRRRRRDRRDRRRAGRRRRGTGCSPRTQPGYGFVDEKTPELSIAVAPLHRRKGIGGTLLRAAMVQAREEGYQSLSLSVAVHNRSRMMYQRVGFEKVGEQGENWTMLVNL